ncbi:TolC family protein [Roseateles sp.]|uniref:TolC family protein n=1 Tax=Roseateles sp. TaxID=1971397 RepID=UPI0025CF2381|nr:TolC family protein [Roseateles sp.]MBV8036187.1 TolC family protein [Roseateles sp.]
MRPSWLCAVVLCAALGAAAQDLELSPALPTSAQAAAWIEADPGVVRARHAAAAAGHGAEALAAGGHEWTLRLQGQQRRYQDGGPASREWLTQLERSLRVNGKAGLDRRLGEVERELAQARVGEARHESARALAELWIAELAARQRRGWADAQLALARANVDAVAKRRRAGDASTLDLQLAQAELGDVQREASLAATAVVKAHAAAQLRFGAEVPVGLVLPEPREPALPQAAWLQRLLDEADPLKSARAELDRARLVAARSRADRVPDPVVGVFAAREARGNERLLGLSLTLPIGGAQRTQRALQFEREVDAAQAALDEVRRGLELEAAQAWADANGSLERWRLARDTAALAAGNAGLTQRAYALGEADLQTLLQARRQAAQSGMAALEAQAEALRWEARLLVDAHLIWDLAHD